MSTVKENKAICYEENKAYQQLSIVTDLIILHPYAFIDLSNEKINIIAEMNQSIHWWSASHWCNNGLIAQQISAVVRQYYNLSAIYQTLKWNIEVEAKMVNISVTNTSLTGAQMTTSITLFEHSTSLTSSGIKISDPNVSMKTISSVTHYFDTTTEKRDENSSICLYLNELDYT